ncbi:MAG: efflux RND transporter permease subunit [Tannerella sp.]|jgi:HAE1 family hydrophobic/amphiphilic exporter-1|nr:efflux RND transporter permease subunit [Tannerella sp.]
MLKQLLSRPVFATVISIVICVLGALGYVSLPIEQFPNIAPPMVFVQASYPGANAQTVLKSVIAPLEEQINGVEGMTYMTSNANNNGNGSIRIFFDLSVDPNIAQVNVQNAVSAALSKLPTAVTEFGVTTRKLLNNQLLVGALYSENPQFDETFLQNYLMINIIPQIARVQGVGQVNAFGARNYSMRIWLDPTKMASYNLIPADVIAAIQEQNVEAAPGQFGLQGDQQFQYTLTYKGKFTEAPDYENIVIKALTDGRILRIKDVATIDLGAFDYALTAAINGNYGAGFFVNQTTGTDAHKVVIELKDLLVELSKAFPPGVEYTIINDANRFLDASINKVKNTLIEAFILVFLVVFLFLQDWKSTLIPGISALVSIVGTFFFLNIIGFSLNLMTMFALVLSIGIVVDNAIVVVEAVHAKLENDASISAHEATSTVLDEITTAIISITLVMAAVFIPVSFLTGPSGVFYRQFGLTMAIAIVISAVNSLTLSPVLCTILIGHKHEKEGKRSLMARFQRNFNIAFDAVLNRYRQTLRYFTKRRWIPVAILLIFGLAAYQMLQITPTAFIPNEDQGIISGDVAMPPGTSLEQTNKVMLQIDSIMSEMPVFASRMVTAGQSMLTSTNGSSHGMITSSLIHWDERPKTSVTDVIASLNQQVSTIKEGKILFYAPPPVRGFGQSDGFEVQLQDKTGGDINKLYDVLTGFLNMLSARPEIDFATTSFNINFPAYEFDVAVDKCKMEGVGVNEVFNALQAYYGGMMVSDFNLFTKYSRVMIQAPPEDRVDLNSLSRIMVRNQKGQMVPISTLLTFRKVQQPESMTRYNMFTAATISGKQKTGYSSGDAIAAVREEAAKLQAGYEIEFSGMSRAEIKSGSESLYVFLLCFLFVYLILCAQYESYILPWSILLSMLIGLFGVYFFVYIWGLTNNIYVQVSLIMLIGLLGKNGILIVEFARQRHEQGMSYVEAAVEGATVRLRPILMTSFAFICGMLPLIIEGGAGSAGNHSIGVAAAGGMLIGTLFGVVVTPTLYVIFASLDAALRKKKQRIV